MQRDRLVAVLDDCAVERKCSHTVVVGEDDRRLVGDLGGLLLGDGIGAVVDLAGDLVNNTVTHASVSEHVYPGQTLRKAGKTSEWVLERDPSLVCAAVLR